MYRVWEIEVISDPGTYLVAMSACREVSVWKELLPEKGVCGCFAWCKRRATRMRHRT